MLIGTVLLFVLSLHWRAICSQDPQVVQSCTKYKKDLYEERIAISFFFANAPVVYETVDNCHVSRPLIVGGQPAEGKEFPPIARLGHYKNKQTKWFCGGTLISDKVVLTAAHCLYSIHGEPNIVRLGELDFNSNTDDADPQDFGVRTYLPHPDYKDNELYNDIALIWLSEAVKFNLYKHPACLPYDDGSRHNNFTAIGWGSTKLAAASSSILLKVKLRSYGNVCREKIENNPSLPRGYDAKTQLCVGSSERKDTCSGDSGGPLLAYHDTFPCMYNIMGITSTGISCGTPDFPGVYTRVHSYLDWIKEEMSKN